jgi:hypothetical protein
MENKYLDFGGFLKIFEGGAAIKSSRPIREDEFPETLESIKDILLPLMDIDPTKIGKDYIVIGSIGKKKNPSDLSGDLDLGYDGNYFSRSHGISYKECSKKIYDILLLNLKDKLGFEPEINFLRGLNIVSVGWPINGNPDLGIVQLDLIPLSSMEWAKFIYYSPDYRFGESKYKSAHRNWLFSAILAAKRNVLDSDEEGEVLDYETPVIILSDGLFLNKKSFRGKLKGRLKNPKKVEGGEKFITNNPQEFLDFTLGKGYSPDQVKTFESVFKIITSPNFSMKDQLPVIKERFLEYMERTGLPVPSEIGNLPSE